MARANDAGQAAAQAIDKWRVAFEKLLQAMDGLATYADERQPNGVVYYPANGEGDISPKRTQELFGDLLKARKAIAKLLGDGAKALLAQAGELRELQAKIMPRLLLAQNQLRRPEYAWARLEPLAYATRRWAVELAEQWESEDIANDLQQQAFADKRESCPWGSALASDIRHHFGDELSQLLRDLATHPLVSSNGKSPTTPSTKQGGGGRKRTSKGELTNAQELLAAALREWHGYESESLSCTRCEAISYAVLLQRSGVRSKSTAKQFFASWLTQGGNREYKRLCNLGDGMALALALAKLNREGLLQVVSITGKALADEKAKRPGDDIDD